MSTTDTAPVETAPGSPHEVRRSRMRIWIAVAVAATMVVAGGVTTFATTRHLDGQYGPIESGFAWGPANLTGIVFGKDGFSERMSTTPGATAHFFELARNDGAHSVEITSIPTDDIVSNVRWSRYRTVNGGSVMGEKEPWRAFPAIVPAGGQIRLLITIHRPAVCADQPEEPGAGEFYGGDLTVHWQSLLGSHTSHIAFGEADDGIQVC